MDIHNFGDGKWINDLELGNGADRGIVIRPPPQIPSYAPFGT